MNNSMNIGELEEARTGLYNIYKAYLLKNIESDQAIKSIIDYSEDYEVKLTKHLNNLLVELTVKLLIKINPKSPLVFKFIEGGILDNGLMLKTRIYLYHLEEQYFSDELDNLQDFILRFLPSFFPQNIEFDGVDVIKAGLTQFLFQTYKTLSTYFSNHPFKFNRNFNGFTNGDILILKRENNPYSEEIYPIQYLYDINDNERVLNDGIKLLQLGFTLQIYKLIIKDFNSAGLFFNIPSTPDIPMMTACVSF